MLETLNLITASPVFTVVKSLIDLVAVAYLFYFLYQLFENTNSISVVKGFVLVLVIYALSNFIGLKTLTWIFQYVVSSFPILVVVLFQPEIRRVLTRIGQNGWAAITTKVSRETVIEVTEAALLMSERREGGLIIIERKVGLKHLLEEAVILDAEVKSELLEAIFHKGGVLHDGAVLVQGDKITGARIIIPSVRIDQEVIRHTPGLGTRHRAGVALTVDTDALTVIISEESGHMSLAHRGRLEYNLSVEKLSRRLNEIIGLE